MTIEEQLKKIEDHYLPKSIKYRGAEKNPDRYTHPTVKNLRIQVEKVKVKFPDSKDCLVFFEDVNAVGIEIVKEKIVFDEENYFDALGALAEQHPVGRP